MLKLHSLRLKQTCICPQPRISRTSTLFLKQNVNKNSISLPYERSISTSTQLWKHTLRRPKLLIPFPMKNEHVVLLQFSNIFVQKNLAHTSDNQEKKRNNKRKQHGDPMASTAELLKWLLEGKRWMYVGFGPIFYVLLVLLVLHYLLEDKKQQRREVLAYRTEMEKDGPPDFKKRAADEYFYQKLIISAGAMLAVLVIPLTAHLRHRNNMRKSNYVQETLALTRETFIYVAIPNAFTAPFLYAVNQKHRKEDYLSMWNGFWTGVMTALATHAVVVPYWMLCIPQREIKSQALSAWLNQTSIVIKQFMHSTRMTPSKTYLGASAFLLAILGPFTIPFNGFMFSFLSLAFQKTHLKPWKEHLKKRKDEEEEKAKLKAQEEERAKLKAQEEEIARNKPQTPETPVPQATPEKVQTTTQDQIPPEKNPRQPPSQHKQGDHAQANSQTVSETTESSRGLNKETDRIQGLQGKNQPQVVEINVTQSAPANK